ncbi:MAG: cation-translocating P-type ATPase [Thermoleophilia bacterium]
MDPNHTATTAHHLAPEKVTSLLETDGTAGLSRSAAGDRLDLYGRNKLPSEPIENPLRVLAGQFSSVLVILLLAAAALSLVIWIVRREETLPFDFIVIMAIVVANAILGFFQEYRAERSLEKLQVLSGPHAIVMRGGHQMNIAASELVPGDLLILATGDRVLADARLLHASSLYVNESTLTGESSGVHKKVEPVPPATPLADRTSMVYAGTTVSAGKGRALVTATGSASEVGRIAELIRIAERPPTPLEKSLDHLGKRLGLLIVVISLIVAATGLLLSGPFNSTNLLNIIMFSVALAVAAIPEGLPAVVTGALALGTQRMARRQAIVRKLPAVETLGSTTAICSDKTGTLTMGEMTVRELWLPQGRVTFSGAGYEPTGEASGPAPAMDASVRLAMSAVLCNDASIREDDDRWHAVGTPTEASLVAMAVKLGIDYAHLRGQNQRLSEQHFTSERKMMSVIVSAGAGGGVLHAKGAPEILLPRCTHVATGKGVVKLGDDDRQRFLETAADMAASTLRTLAVASRVLEPGAVTADSEADLVFLGLAGIADPPRPEAKQSILKCQRAGIQVFMVTGDHVTTAEAIAAELGIHGKVLSGPEIDLADDKELRHHMEDVRIFARVSSGHKVRIVTALQSLGHTVAVTGDGVNDAPALKAADIGVAMGRSGTDVAREAADMVLADDNFATIVAAVEEGRAIFANIRKFIAYLLSSNAGAVIMLFAGILLAGFLDMFEDGKLMLPLLAVQILWINLVTNGLPALALGVEPKNPHAMNLPPRPIGEQMINRNIWNLIALVGVVSSAGTLFILDAYSPGGMFTIFPGHSTDYARTMAFVVLALFQIFNTFNCRRLNGSSLPHLLGNYWLLLAVFISTGMMVTVVYISAMQTAFRTVPLAPVDWLVATLIASSVLWAVEIYQLARKRFLTIRES